MVDLRVDSPQTHASKADTDRSSIASDSILTLSRCSFRNRIRFDERKAFTSAYCSRFSAFD
jgi:hypothetical protein